MKSFTRIFSSFLLLAMLTVIGGICLTSCSTPQIDTSQPKTHLAKISYVGSSAEVWVNQTKQSFSGTTIDVQVKQGDIITILAQGTFIDNSNNYNAANVNINAEIKLKIDNKDVANGTTHLYYIVT